MATCIFVTTRGYSLKISWYAEYDGRERWKQPATKWTNPRAALLPDFLLLVQKFSSFQLRSRSLILVSLFPFYREGNRDSVKMEWSLDGEFTFEARIKTHILIPTLMVCLLHCVAFVQTTLPMFEMHLRYTIWWLITCNDYCVEIHVDFFVMRSYWHKLELIFTNWNLKEKSFYS